MPGQQPQAEGALVAASVTRRAATSGPLAKAGEN
jgi:hypothetical protein